MQISSQKSQLHVISVHPKLHQIGPPQMVMGKMLHPLEFRVPLRNTLKRNRKMYSIDKEKDLQYLYETQMNVKKMMTLAVCGC